MTPDQLEIVDWLRRNAPSLVDVFAGAVHMLATRPPAYLKFVGHVVRDIGNLLPQVIAGVNQKQGHLDYPKKVDVLYREWTSAGLLALDFSRPDAERPAIVAVPFRQFRLCVELLESHQLASDRPTSNAQRLFAALAPENAEAAETMRPVIAQWRDVTGWFMARTHARVDAEDPTPHEEILGKFAIFERTLLAMIRGFYETVEQIDAILEETNS